MHFDVVAVGTLNADMIIIGDAPRDMEALTRWVDTSRVEITAAGSVGYCAIDMARLGLSVSMLSSVADDDFGELVRKKLRAEGINTEAITVEKGESSGIGIYMLLFGDRKRPLTGRLATHAPWPKTLSPVAEKHLQSARLLHCGGYLHYSRMWGAPTENLFRAAKERGLITSLDTQFPMSPEPPPWKRFLGGLLEYTDVVFTDDVESVSITGDETPEAAAESLLAAGPKLVVVKLGAKGALLATKDGVVREPAFKMAEITDSIGAGDAFDAGVLFGVLADWPVERTARFAAAAAALTLRGMGGSQTAPTLREVEEFLSSRD